ncbi:type II toxin-antitoxin system RelE/ParE family toxin [Flavobacterium difficile]|uniref:Type II toxin-antitoxin system RelE/ParE family toxin n=1 Tax=Flavobacterium difficile TaxID=2709659 RepID=A0ABX0I3P6_9FLAO|nr:type II toxin-antitoxin system RelE/ParE family toxin [Flavobacterium difficile]NHM01414.1 type II toxin-antitoxin system RelE/ParE family toxin [Flavobacterium difficile]
MRYSVFFEPNAITDIQEAVTYYDLKKEGLGEVFYESIENAVETIIINPNFQIRYKDYIGLPLKKFPFIVFYYILEETKKIHIISVFNTSKNPNTYYDK